MTTQITVGNITTQNLVPAGVATDASAVEIDLVGADRLCAQVTGTYTGALSVQVTVDCVNWITLGAATTVTRQSTGVATATITSAEQDIYALAVPGATKARVTGLAAMTGTARVTLRAVTHFT